MSTNNAEIASTTNNDSSTAPVSRRGHPLPRNQLCTGLLVITMTSARNTGPMRLMLLCKTQPGDR